MKLRTVISGAAFALALAVGAGASAATYTFSLSGSGFTGSGKVTTTGATRTNTWPCATCASTTGEIVGSISGFLNGHAITGLLPVGGFAGNDNAIYPSAGGPYLDWGDLGFASNGVNYNAFQGDYDSHPGYFLAASNIGGTYSSPISFTLGVPEPATWAMLLIGMGGIGAMMRSRRRASGVAV